MYILNSSTLNTKDSNFPKLNLAATNFPNSSMIGAINKIAIRIFSPRLPPKREIAVSLNAVQHHTHTQATPNFKINDP